MGKAALELAVIGAWDGGGGVGAGTNCVETGWDGAGTGGACGMLEGTGSKLCALACLCARSLA